MSGRHFLPLTEEERREMLQEIGVSAVDDLFQDIPREVKLEKPLELAPALSEREALKHLEALASKNRNTWECASFLGGGIYDHFIPSIVKHVTGRSEFYTAYTPYQAEISQGMLQAIFEYQTLICQLTGMDLANASLYDGATAVAEGALMACSVTRRGKVLVSRSVSPFSREVLRTYFAPRGIELVEIPLHEGKTDLEQAEAHLGRDTAALVLQTPNFFGLLEEMEQAAELAHGQGALLVAAVDPISLPLVQAPAEYGADIAVGEGQGLGTPPSFGGPLLGFLSAREQYLRNIPGRIVGETADTGGNRGFVLTLQTREQHIRRERATSNICTNEALIALAAAVHMAALGPQGMYRVAEACLKKAYYAREQMASQGFEIPFGGVYFKEFPVKLPWEVSRLNQKLMEKNIFGGLDLGRYYPELENTALFCVTENRTRAEIDALVKEMGDLK